VVLGGIYYYKRKRQATTSTTSTSAAPPSVSDKKQLITEEGLEMSRLPSSSVSLNEPPLPSPRSQSLSRIDADVSDNVEVEIR
jgi:hypothetical protein